MRALSAAQWRAICWRRARYNCINLTQADTFWHLVNLPSRSGPIVMRFAHSGYIPFVTVSRGSETANGFLLVAFKFLKPKSHDWMLA